MDDAESTPPSEAARPAPSAPKAEARTERARRLASALRDNLKRRKAGSGKPRPAKPSN